MRHTVLCCVLAVLSLAGSAVADQVAVGTLDFHVVISPDPDTGDGQLNGFFTLNLTGGGLFADSLVFANGQLTLAPSDPTFIDLSHISQQLLDQNGCTAGSILVCNIPGTLAAGDTYSLNLLFPDTTKFTSATFTGAVVGQGWALTGNLVPTDGSDFLVASSETSAFIYAEVPVNGDPPTQVPEPATLVLLASGLAGALGRGMAGARKRG